MGELKRVIGIPIGLPATAWIVRLASHYVLKLAPELVLYGRYVVPKRPQDGGFEFTFSDLGQALQDPLKIRKR
ncbi:MAG: DUF1731 domain-containing protein [Pirellulaceae bacterium]|nr:DUF1731 domain-containing protein [Pirellulaceae bacterium]